MEKNTIKSKSWIITFFVILLVGLSAYAVLNITVDPTEYFAVKKNKETVQSNHYTRALKIEYFMRHKNDFNAVIIGGSKAGVLNPEQLNAYTGKSYYNMNFNHGNFADYYDYLEFLIEHANIEEVLLHLSSYEVRAYDFKNYGNDYKDPAILSGNKLKECMELLAYTFTDLKTTYKKIVKTIKGKTSLQTTDVLKTGQRFWLQCIDGMQTSLIRHIEKNTLVDLQNRLTRLFRQEATTQPAFDQNIECLKRIKALCDDHGVTLNVVIGASFMGERSLYECYRYYDYLADIVQITDVWDFSDYNDINMNPYNFYNRGHYTIEIGQMMIDTMYGGENTYEGFGIHLTKDNFDEYLARRIADYNRLKKEFEETGTVQLQGLYDESYIPIEGSLSVEAYEQIEAERQAEAAAAEQEETENESEVDYDFE